MKIAIEGCAHGELEKIYDTLTYLEQKDNVKIDLLLCCGDFQSTRNMEDLRCMAVPPKYQDMCTFYKYYSGEKVAPILTLFIGGNHEASNYLQELAYGGWVAPNIYYMGYASVVNFGGIRIAGVSGIYKGHDYMKGHFEKPPYAGDTIRSAYHVRNVEIFRLKQVKQPIDIIMSHDWPRGVYNYGNVEELLRRKPFFRGDIEANALGSKPCEELLHHLKPAYWFAAHLHCKFAALVSHDSEEGDEGKLTKFLALDKCLPKRQFLQVVNIPHDEKKPLELEYDLEWLTILHFTNHLLSVKKNMQYMPGPGHHSRWIFTPTKEEMELVHGKFSNDLRIPSNFTQTATSYDPNESTMYGNKPHACLNPQTMLFCEQLGIDDPMALLLGNTNTSMNISNANETLPSFLTPERPGDSAEVSFASSQDSSLVFQDSKNTSVEFGSPRALPKKRMNMTLPSPKNESLDSVINTSLESGLAELSPSSKSSQPEARLPSPIAADRPACLSRISLVLPSPNTSCDTKDTELGKEGYIDDAEVETSVEKLEGTRTNNGSVEVIDITDSDAVAVAPDNGEEVSKDPQPQVKRFKRRNQALYTSTDDE